MGILRDAAKLDIFLAPLYSTFKYVTLLPVITSFIKFHPILPFRKKRLIHCENFEDIWGSNEKRKQLSPPGVLYLFFLCLAKTI